MPHYVDGTEARVGDQVIAPVFNSGGPKAGVIISITPGVESCNALIQFAEVRPWDESVPLGEGTDFASLPRMTVRGPVTHGGKGYSVPICRLVKGEAHGSAGPTYAVFVCADYCDTNKLTKVG